MEFKENAKPIYLQIADRICDLIMAGNLPPGSRMPSVREYAGLLQVNANTVMRTYDHLAARDIIYNKRGIGFFVADNACELIESLRNATFFNDEINYFFSRLASIGTSPTELADLYAKYLNKQ